MGKGAAQIQIADYYLSIHMGVCLRVDKVHEVRISEKSIGITAPVTDTSLQDIDQSDLFGGPKEGGGVRGRLHFFFGHEDQIMPAEVADRFARTPTTMPGWRNLFSIFLHGAEAGLGWLWGTNNPVLPSLEVDAEWAPKLLAGSPLIGTAGEVNPAHIIYECMVDSEFGLGTDPDTIETSTYLAAAATLAAENFGLAFLWLRSTSIEQFISNVLDHIAATNAPNPRTGRWELRLLRDDYDIATLREINPTNAKLIKFQRKGWGETVNEVSLSYTNPESEELETLTVHDNANISIQGVPVNDPVEREGIRRKALAQYVAERELRQRSTPTAAAEVEVDRTLWDIMPGEVYKFSWPEEGIAQLIMRVGPVDYGTVQSAKIRVNLVEDIFSVGLAIFLPPENNWVDPDQPPTPITLMYLMTAPYFALVATRGEVATEAMAEPEVAAMLLLASTNSQISSIDILTERADANGVLAYRESGRVGRMGYGTLSAGLNFEATSTFTLASPIGPAPRAGSFIVLEDGTNEELLLVTAYSAPSITAKRGALDTYPQIWPSGTRAWVIVPGARVMDETPRIEAETPKYKFLPITSLGRLREADADVVVMAALTDRQHRPYRPANITVNGQLNGGTMTVDAAATVIPVTWSRRNRLTETSQILSWTAADVAPEAGQTVTIEVRKASDDSLLVSHTGETGTSRDIAIASLGTLPQDLKFILWSVRDGLDSTKVVVPVSLSVSYAFDPAAFFLMVSPPP